MLNKKAQFSIIAALLVAVVLVGASVTCYSAIRYNIEQEEQQPQIVSVIDETNLGLKEILGFTVGYYGSVLKVTGNMTYAQQLATNYLKSGLNNLGQIKPDWGLSFELLKMTVNATWFSNQSYSQGSLSVNYNLTGKGIYGASYSTWTRLDVQIMPTEQPDKAQLMILRDEGQPLINLGKSNLQLYRYNYQNSSWQLEPPVAIASYADGSYILDLPSGVASSAYVIQVQDTRGLMVLAASSTAYTSTIAWNATGFREGVFDYVDSAYSGTGTHSNFGSQMSAPDGSYDILTEEAYGVFPVHSYPTGYNMQGSTALVSGGLGDLQSNNGVYQTFRSYPSGFSGSASLGYSTVGAYTVAIENAIRGSLFSIPEAAQVQNITVYLELSSATNRKVKTAIYSEAHNYIATSEERTISSTDLYTFNFDDPKPILAADTNYVLTVWADSAPGTVSVRYDAGTTNQGHYRTNQNYGSWPNSVNFNHDTNKYSIYCGYNIISEYGAMVEFSGTSSTAIPWVDLAWAIDSSATTNGVTATYQLYDWISDRYATSGNGYLTATIGTSDTLSAETISANFARFLSGTSTWKINITATKPTTASFDLNLDLVRYSPELQNYALNLEERWLDVNSSNVRQDLCIKTGNLAAEALVVQVFSGGVWRDLMNLRANYFNNASLAPYIDASTLAIRFVGGNDATDPSLDSWNIDSVFIKDQPDVNWLIKRQQSTIAIEVLQNGTMRWLGQNLQVTTQTLPVPPVPVKSIHINQTINGVNQEVPFQIEDWASDYQIPLGLTSNSTVFGNRQMIVFLINSAVSDFTIWWDGQDNATQTSMAYTNRYFTNDNPGANTLTNGNLTIQFNSGAVKATVAGASSYSTATFMRINAKDSSYGGGASYVIHHGIVRDVVQEEAEFSNGISGCPNVYANVVITLPANSTYYTYNLRLMFNSAQARTITNLCPIKLTTSLSSVQTQTENNTLAGFPILQNGTGVFSNYASPSWTPHHFAQYVTDALKGAGIMFTDRGNQKLYTFDSMAGSPTGALNVAVSTPLIELLPVSLASVSFTSAYDITWTGAVVTFDNSTPLCTKYDDTTPTGIWLLAEYPPVLTLTAKS